MMVSELWKGPPYPLNRTLLSYEHTRIHWYTNTPHNMYADTHIICTTPATTSASLSLSVHINQITCSHDTLHCTDTARVSAMAHLTTCDVFASCQLRRPLRIPMREELHYTYTLITISLSLSLSVSLSLYIYTMCILYIYIYKYTCI